MTTRREAIEAAWDAYLSNLDAGPRPKDAPGDYDRRITLTHVALRAAFKLPLTIPDAGRDALLTRVALAVRDAAVDSSCGCAGLGDDEVDAIISREKTKP